MTAKIKLNAASGGGSISIQAPSSSSNNRVISLPDIADGTLVTSQSTLDATKLSGNLPAISGAALTGISAGITMADSWYVGAGLDPGAGSNTITANWTRNTEAIYGSIGSAMTQSSGLFSFPSTGIYYMCINGGYYRSNTSEHNYLGFTISATNNNGSSFDTAASVYNAFPSQGGNTYSSMTTYFVFDCTNTSTHKVRFQTEADASGTTLVDVAGKRLNVVFIRLGDT